MELQINLIKKFPYEGGILYLLGIKLDNNYDEYTLFLHKDIVPLIKTNSIQYNELNKEEKEKIIKKIIKYLYDNK